MSTATDIPSRWVGSIPVPSFVEGSVVSCFEYAWAITHIRILRPEKMEIGGILDMATSPLAMSYLGYETQNW